jgi:hypothetical protein
MARAEVFAPDEVAVVHVMNRVVRRCYLLGNDPVSGKNYDHRKVMIELQLQRLAGAFGIDLLGFAIMSARPWGHWAGLKICCDFAQIVCVSGFDHIGFGAE